MFGESDFYSRMKMPVWLIRPQQAAVTPGQQTSESSCAEEENTAQKIRAQVSSDDRENDEFTMEADI